MRRHTYPGAREGTSHPPRICRSPSSIFGLVEDQVEVGAMGLADESHAKELRRCFEPIIFGVTFDPIVGAPSKLKTACCKDYGPNRALLPANITAATVMACVANVVMSHEGNAAVDLRSTYRRQESAESIFVPVAEAAIDLLTTGDFDLVKRCENQTCVRWFFDQTKSHRRRWCSMELCGNRHKVAAYRTRRRDQSVSS